MYVYIYIYSGTAPGGSLFRAGIRRFRFEVVRGGDWEHETPNCRKANGRVRTRRNGTELHIGTSLTYIYAPYIHVYIYSYLTYTGGRQVVYTCLYICIYICMYV
ncbi:hypothetical protein GGS23DRAFT_564643 [Durotheca rogersii]|uniref:uncharacterized protein n=1 Tax=Durotheca rogersii TaxID=419775 RepID=UPI00221FCF4E|nr:uncharacterized protein GGS23DRAFT_564643 [Durotheca rogersii]KAI5863625.1 hypothetical protein GGS23DRAFT_564643 [Durotheca rogersii]